jgi:predicted transcriptional regulator
MPVQNPPNPLSRRERQIMDVIYRRERASAADVLADLPDPPSYSAVRALLRILEEKGHVTHVEDGPRYVFLPTHPRQSAARTAIEQVVRTFFGGSVESAVATMLSTNELKLGDDEIDRIEKLIRQARQEMQPRDSEEHKQ